MSKIVGSSLKRLNTCHPSIQEVIHEASIIMDMSVVCGVRGEEAQNKAFRERKTKVQYPNSKHNLKPGQEWSMAVDVMPYFPNPLKRNDWDDLLAFARLAGVILTVAHQKGIRLRWGGDWDRDYQSKDETFLDLPHFELDTQGKV